MGGMFRKFKGHQVQSKVQGQTPLAGGQALTKAELQDLIAQKRLAAKQRQADTGEQDGPEGPEPTRYGDWEIGGKVSDF